MRTDIRRIQAKDAVVGQRLCSTVPQYDILIESIQRTRENELKFYLGENGDAVGYYFPTEVIWVR